MSDIVIRAENLGKSYIIGHEKREQYVALRDVFSNKVKQISVKTRQIFHGGQLIAGNELEEFWALKDINFEIKQGDRIGIIGRNGAGKSTLLKVLSRITEPTTGRIKINGRIASLLEVGTGFHPELSGKENIFLNGAILGMSRIEIKKKFDEIVNFSGVENFLDTPVKRYSSGMYVRLAFSIAAHLESEILIVDEVLAVGDAEFQKKCLGKMGEVSKDEGRTVLFVSHNMAAVKALCENAIYLDKGQIEFMGKVNTTLKEYLTKPLTLKSANDFLDDNKSRRGNGEVRFTEIIVNKGALTIDPTQEIRFVCKAEVYKNVDQLYFSLMFIAPESTESLTNTGFICLSNDAIVTGKIIDFEFSVLPNVFRTGLFPLYFWLGKNEKFTVDQYPFDVVDSIYNLNITSDKSRDELGYESELPGGYFNFNYNIDKIKIS